MKIRIYLFGLFLSQNIAFGQNIRLDYFVIHCNLGIPIGETHYSNSNLSDTKAALFSNMKNVVSLGTDFVAKVRNNLGLGLYLNYGFFNSWSNDKSSRFNNIKLRVIEIGPMISLKTGKNSLIKTSRYIICPLFTRVMLSNPNNSYNFIVSSLNDGTILEEKISVQELYKQKSIWMPGIYLGKEWSVFINEKFAVSIRLGLNMSYVNSDAFPDRYLFFPSINLGWGINNNRDKWFFLK